MQTLSRVTLSLLLVTCFASLAQAQATAPNLYLGSMNGQVGFGVSIPFAGNHTEPGGPVQSPNIRGVGVPGPIFKATTARANVTSGGAFTLPAGDFFISTSYVNPNPTTPTIQYSGSKAMLQNSAGSFGPGFFTGAFGTSNTATIIGVGAVGTPSLGTAIFKPGGGFGGVMRLAGTFVNNLSIQTTNLGISTAVVPLTPKWLGGSNAPTTSNVPAVFRNTELSPSTTTLPLKFSGFPWITGEVTLIQTQGLIASLLTEIGKNTVHVTLNANGHANAVGNIKMVTGWMTHFLFLDENVGEFELTVTFLPEPNNAMLLGAGALFIAALYQVRRRSA